ncbi:hypothetical protein PZ895_14025 [Mesorhizobium sp. YIM 152430]|uniref:hypothetical protein n=1 Tax=Mesorhizobium sp. YIM 152430 TaxID=3031761 RepID=UPI0023DA513E|nr:hypothetical protein [Mesorhizobium sp. YIM 152430]MDF1600882.1 hypothetical protein [Mesorhizobium sp. YIM 152430]
MVNESSDGYSAKLHRIGDDRWTCDTDIRQIEDLLEAAREREQFVALNGRVYGVRLVEREQRESARTVLSRGGPLEG